MSRGRGRPVTGSPKRGPDGRWTVRVPLPNTSRHRRVKLGEEVTTLDAAIEAARTAYSKIKGLSPDKAAETVRKVISDSSTDERFAFLEQRIERLETLIEEMCS